MKRVLAAAAHAVDHLGIDAGPEEREVADVAVDLLPGRTFAVLRLDQHVGHLH